jgi:signal transduction histidine kinase/DNA-binding response OmpR family regulator/sugar lactone lactonase YvrE
VAEDERGIIWVGTNKGLSRYDGHEFKSFYSSDGLREEAIWEIIPNGRKLLLLHRIGATEKFSAQLDLFDIYEENATPFESYVQPSLPFDWGQVLHCKVFPEDQLAFFLKGGACYAYSLQDQRWRPLAFPAEEALLAAEPNGRYWTQKKAGSDLVLNLYHAGHAPPLRDSLIIPDKDLIRYMQPYRGDTALFLTSAPRKPDLLWVWAKEDSLAWAWSPTKLNILKQQLPSFDFHATFNELQYLPEQKAYWASREGMAILLFENGESVTVQHESLRALTSWRRSNLVQGNTIWQCSHNGLYQVALLQSSFKTAFTQLDRPMGFRGILRFGETLYFNCHEGAIPFSQKDTNRLNPLVPMGLSATTDPNNRLWTGNYGSLFAYHASDQTTTSFPIPVNEPWSLYADTSGYVWMSNMGLYRLDPQTGITTRISKPEVPQLDNSLIYHFFEEAPGKVWLCSTTGLYLFNPYTQELKRYGPDEPETYRLPAQDVRHVYFDSLNNIFWLASADRGLIRWDRTRHEAETFLFREGKSHILHSVYADDSGHLWLSSEFGIVQFDPRSERFRIYTIRDGLNTNEFNRISHFQDEDGTLYFGSMNGVTYFHPRDFAGELLPNVDVRPQVVKVVQYLGNKNRTVNVTNTFLDQGKITLAPDDRFLTLTLAMEDVKLGAGTTYRYKLQRQREEWLTTKGNTITLGRLPYGQQTLLVQAQLENGLRSATPLEVPIFVKRPFYLRWWFFLCMAALLTAGIYWRTRQLDRRNRELEAEVKKRTETIAKDREVIRQQAEELKQLDELKSRFFANLSHELRTPLTLILSPLNQLLKPQPKEKQHQLIALAQQQSRKLLQLVNDIMALSKLESTALEVYRQPTPLLPLLKQLISTFELQAQRGEINLSLQYEATEPLTLLLDAKKTETILYNFLANALKFTPAGGQITLVANVTGADLQIEVRDTGRGIPAADLPHVFERYFQSKVHRAAEGGSGLGLALSRELATLLGGRVWAESTVGKGSRFFLQLPVEMATATPLEPLPDPNPVEQAAPPALTRTEGQPRVFIVEDHHDMRNYLQQLLGVHYQVSSARNGAEALDHLDANGNLPDLILSDVMMPVMDGFELLTRLKAQDRYSSIPVIMLTARAAMADRLSALRVGVDDYLAKPFVEEELLARIRNLLRHANIRAQQPEEATTDDRPAPEKANAQQAWLQKAEDIVQTHLSEQQFSVDFVAKQLSMSRHTLNRKLRQHTGLTTSQYIQEVRLDHARKLLERSEVHSVAELADACGISDTKYFSRLFKKRFGQPPSYYL